MDNGMIRKYEKAKMYAEQPERFEINTLVVTVDGKNDSHTVEYSKGRWQCDCHFFQSRERCAHTMALEIMLKDMLPTPIAG